MEKITFLGSCGGRVAMVRQVRGTGGFVINTKNHQIHVDPGPGAIVYANKFKTKPHKTDILIVTHNHTDHTSDADVITEAMVVNKKEKILITNETCLNGGGNFIPILPKYYLKNFDKIILSEIGKEVKINEDLKIKFWETEHSEPKAFGFFLSDDQHKIGYTSDTSFKERLAGHYKSVDVLILNALRPNSDHFPGHMCSEDVMKILKIAKPKIAILNHFGFKMIKAGPEKEAKVIEKETGVKTIAAYDGMIFDFKEPKLPLFS